MIVWIGTVRLTTGLAYDGTGAHEPWRQPDGYARGYPARIVDHDRERRDALARYAAGRA
jgi:deoxyribodipyrimidine photo-lyase